MRPNKQSRFQPGKRCRRGHHYPRAPFRERPPVAAPSARCECGRWVLFYLDGLSDQLGPVIVPDDVVPPALLRDDGSTAHDDSPVLAPGVEGVQVWARIAWKQRAFLAALLYAQDRWIRGWTWLVDGFGVSVAVVCSVVAVRLVGWPTVAAWPRWALVTGWLFGGMAVTAGANLLSKTRRARRVGEAMRRYGVDEALLREARSVFQTPRPRRPR